MFGVASSAITATHSVVIKQSLPVVDGSALLLSWYTNLLSAVALAPIIVLAGEGGGVLDLLTGGLVNTRTDGGLGPVATFVWGSFITVSVFRYQNLFLGFQSFFPVHRVPLAS
jgi:GDP-fucose transporter C1